MEAHRLASGKGQAFVELGSSNTEFYASVLSDLQADGRLPGDGVHYDPYSSFTTASRLVAVLRDGEMIQSARVGDEVELVLTISPLYLESGGQVGDKGKVISGEQPAWEVEVTSVHKPVSGLIVHSGIVTRGAPRVDGAALVSVDVPSRQATMRNQQPADLLHGRLRQV